MEGSDERIQHRFDKSAFHWTPGIAAASRIVIETHGLLCTVGALDAIGTRLAQAALLALLISSSIKTIVPVTGLECFSLQSSDGSEGRTYRCIQRINTSRHPTTLIGQSLLTQALLRENGGSERNSTS